MASSSSDDTGAPEVSSATMGNTVSTNDESAFAVGLISTRKGSCSLLGNAFLEAIYYRKPIVVNVYSIYLLDIRPKGFQAIELHGYVTEEALEQTRKILDNEDLRKDIADRNYELALKYYSFTVLERKLRNRIADCLGTSN
jgi:hypothetical protein